MSWPHTLRSGRKHTHEEKEKPVAASARPDVSGTRRNPQVKRGKQTTCKRRHQFSLLFTGTLVKVSPTDGSSTCPLMTCLAHLMKEFRAFYQALDAKKAAITRERQTLSGARVFQAQTAELRFDLWERQDANGRLRDRDLRRTSEANGFKTGGAKSLSHAFWMLALSWGQRAQSWEVWCMIRRNKRGGNCKTPATRLRKTRTDDRPDLCGSGHIWIMAFACFPWL